MALSADASRTTRNAGNVMYADYPVATSATVYKGGLGSIVTSTGRLVAGSAAASRKFVGLITETKTGNAAGTVLARVEWNMEAFLPTSTLIVSARIGTNCAISADDLVTTATNAGTAAVRVLVGEVVQLGTGGAWVAIRKFATAVI